MSQTTDIDFRTFIDRIELMLSKSTDLLPRKNGDDTKENLVNGIIKYTPPLAENPDEVDPPLIYITTSRNPFPFDTVAGRGDRNTKAARLRTLEFYIIIVAQAQNPVESQKQMYEIYRIVSDIFHKNIRMTDTDGANPLSMGIENIYGVPYIIDTEQEDIRAFNVVVRPQVYVSVT